MEFFFFILQRIYIYVQNGIHEGYDHWAFLIVFTDKKTPGSLIHKYTKNIFFKIYIEVCITIFFFYKTKKEYSKKGKVFKKCVFAMIYDMKSMLMNDYLLKYKKSIKNKVFLKFCFF